MENNQSKETIRTVTENQPARSANQSTPVLSTKPVESYRSETQNTPARSITQVDTVRSSKPDSRNRTASITRVVYWLLGVLEGLLAFRFILKLFGASKSSSFVTLIYNITSIFVAPFTGIFKSVVSGFEASTLIAMIAYALVGWGIAKLIAIVTNSSAANQ